MKELVEKRTRTSKVFDLGNGVTRLVSHAYPIHYRDSQGNWENIDRNISKKKAWEFVNASTKNTFRSYFEDDSDASNRHLVSIEVVGENGKEYWVNYKLHGASPVMCEPLGDSYIFIECFDGVDVSYKVVDDYLKEDIILTKKQDITEFIFTLKMGGLAVEESSGDVLFKDTETGDTVFYLDKPFMVDASGTRNDHVGYSLREVDGFPALVVTVTDTSFLESASYPVIIDPTVIVEGNPSNVILATNDNNTGWVFNNTNKTVFGGYYSSVYPYVSALYFKDFDAVKLANKERVVEVSKVTMSLRSHTVYGTLGKGRILLSNLRTTLSAGSVNNADDKFYDSSGFASGEWVDVDLTPNIRSVGIDNFHGVYFGASGYNTGSSYVSPFSQEMSLRPKFTVDYYTKPAFVFHDGSGTSGAEYSGGNDIFKVLNFGNIVAGQTTSPVKVYLRNMTGEASTNVRVFVNQVEFPQNLWLEVSKYNNPFVPEDVIIFNGTLMDGENVEFYARVVTVENTQAGGDIYIYAKADPV